jgi:hypothetical protein
MGRVSSLKGQVASTRAGSPAIADCGLRISGCGLKEAGNNKQGRPCKTKPISGSNRAKRTQFRPAGAADGADCAKRSQTWGDWGMWAKVVAVWDVAWPGSETCKTNPIRGPGAPRLRIDDCGLRIERCRAGTPNPRSGRGRLYEEPKRAKRTQFVPRRREAKFLVERELRKM